MNIIRNFIDLETSGLDPERHGIIQIAGIIDINGEVVERYNSNIKLLPGDKISNKAEEAHGITIDKIRTYPPAEEIKELLIKLFNQYIDPFDKRRKFHFGGYNAYFDMRMLSYWFTEKLGFPNFWSYFWYPPVDVGVLLMDFFAEDRHLFPNFKLSTIAEIFGKEIEQESLHDASYDIELTRDIYYKLKEDPNVKQYLTNYLDVRVQRSGKPIVQSGFRLPKSS